MKITFVTPPPNLSGGARVIATYADELQRRGHEVTIVAQPGRRLSLKGWLKNLSKGRTPKRPPGATHFDTTLARLHIVDHPGPITAEDVPDGDAVIATWWETAFMVAALPPQKGSKFYFVQHHEVHSHLPWHLSSGSYMLPLKKITISSWLVDVMRKVYGDDDVALIQNSVDDALFNAPPRGRQPRPTVGLLYSMNPFKGVNTSFQAVEIARRTHPDLQLEIFGKMPPNRRLPLPEGATYHRAPPQKQIREIYASCDVWLCGSTAEGFHLPPLEAMACRCPVVSTRVGGPRDIVENGKNGFLVDVGDAEALGARLAEVLSLREAEWRSMSDAALATARGYTWQDATDRFEQVIGARTGH